MLKDVAGEGQNETHIPEAPTIKKKKKRDRYDTEASNPLLTRLRNMAQSRRMNTVRPKRYNPSTSERDRTPNHHDNASKT